VTKDRFKIVLLGPISPFKGGISAFNTSLAEELSRSGHDVYPVAWKNGLIGVSRTDQIDESMSVHPKAQFILKWYSPRTWRCAAVYCASLSPDLLVAHWTVPEVAPVYAAIISAFKRRNLNTAIAYIVHNAEPHEPRIGDQFMRWLGFRGVSHFLLHAHSENKKFFESIPQNKIRIGFHPIYDRYLSVNVSATPLSTNRHFPDWFNTSRNFPVLLFFGFVRPYKGLDLLLKAMVHFKEARLIVAGQISKACLSVRDQTDKLGISGRVYWLDRYIADSEVAEIFTAVDVVALPYQSGTQSGVASLAFAFDVPVVATNVGGLGEAIETGVTGYIVPPCDSYGFAQALRDAYENRVSLKNGIRRNKKARSWARYCDILLSCIGRNASDVRSTGIKTR